MKKLIYMITVLTFSSILFSCAEEVVTPMDEQNVTPTEQSTEGGNDPDEDGGSKLG